MAIRLPLDYLHPIHILRSKDLVLMHLTKQKINLYNSQTTKRWGLKSLIQEDQWIIYHLKLILHKDQ